MLDLESIELIKQLKARYFRFLDTRNIEGLQTVFTSDATASFVGGDYDFQLDGWDQLEAFYKKSFTGQIAALLTRLICRAQDDVIDLAWIKLRVSIDQCIDQKGRHIIGARPVKTPSK